MKTQGKMASMKTQNDTSFGSPRVNSKVSSRQRLTRHADCRAQQRAISKECIPLLKAYGQRSYDGRGGVTYLMTGDAVDSLIRAVGRTASIERLEGVYVVLDADRQEAVITLGHLW
jgi:hypothetical protein